MPYRIINQVKTYYEDEGKGKSTLVFGHRVLFNLRTIGGQVEWSSKTYRYIRYVIRKGVLKRAGKKGTVEGRKKSFYIE